MSNQPLNFIQPPNFTPPHPEIYKLMGQENIFSMLEDFYAELEKSSIRAMFPEDMVASSKKSAAFFVGLLGGPPMYHELYGPPKMRARHLNFYIDQRARDIWLQCFYAILEQAEEKYQFPPQYLEGFKKFLDGFSTWMINR